MGRFASIAMVVSVASLCGAAQADDALPAGPELSPLIASWANPPVAAAPPARSTPPSPAWSGALAQLVQPPSPQPPGSPPPGSAPPDSAPAGPEPATAPPPAAPAKSAPASVVQSLAPDEAEAILGRRVADMDGKDLGRLVDVLVDANGQPEAAVIDFGGFLGVGSRKIAVHWSTLHFNPAEGRHIITLDMTPDQIKSAPEYSSTDKAAAVVTPADTPPIAH